jgi:hypothetical protein
VMKGAVGNGFYARFSHVCNIKKLIVPVIFLGLMMFV